MSVRTRFIPITYGLSPLKRKTILEASCRDRGFHCSIIRVTSPLSTVLPPSALIGTYDRHVVNVRGLSKPAQEPRCMQYCVAPSERLERRVKKVTLCPANKGTDIHRRIKSRKLRRE